MEKEDKKDCSQLEKALDEYLEQVELEWHDYGSAGEDTPEKIIKVLIDDNDQVGFLIQWKSIDHRTPGDSIVSYEQMLLHPEFMI